MPLPVFDNGLCRVLVWLPRPFLPDRALWSRLFIFGLSCQNVDRITDRVLQVMDKGCWQW
ncbi:hypothetical protein [Acetobacter syzygii]|uniref:hypothetical protein n=1 Tax=Acetobacter syzygii TaxID=146476 RepID=UPI00157028F4|nr:hypothetical protein [Acetobacter syzygii]